MHKNELSVHRIGSVLKMRQGAAGSLLGSSRSGYTS